tara:strand:- start:215 stop:562 length:348 start_codon:yes stop_codon:yes gene_type:complete
MKIKEVEIGDHIFTDDGGGMTQRSLEYFDTLKGKLGRIIEIHIDSDRNFCWEIFCDAGWVLLSGVNSGYGGEGPHGSLKILDLLGFKKSDEEILKKIFTDKHIRIDCRGRSDCHW